MEERYYTKRIKIHKVWWYGGPPDNRVVHIICSQNHPNPSTKRIEKLGMLANLQSWRLFGKYTENNNEVTCKNCLRIINANPDKYKGEPRESVFKHLMVPQSSVESALHLKAENRNKGYESGRIRSRERNAE